jgi:hypothetical protein
MRKRLQFSSSANDCVEKQARKRIFDFRYQASPNGKCPVTGSYRDCLNWGTRRPEGPENGSGNAEDILREHLREKAPKKVVKQHTKMKKLSSQHEDVEHKKNRTEILYGFLA